MLCVCLWCHVVLLVVVFVVCGDFVLVVCVLVCCFFCDWLGFFGGLVRVLCG